MEALFADGAKRRFEYPDPTFSDGDAGQKQLEWLNSQLEGSTADYLIVIGHRPILSGAVRDHWEAEVMRAIYINFSKTANLIYEMHVYNIVRK